MCSKLRLLLRHTKKVLQRVEGAFVYLLSILDHNNLTHIFVLGQVLFSSACVSKCLLSIILKSYQQILMKFGRLVYCKKWQASFEDEINPPIRTEVTENNRFFIKNHVPLTVFLGYTSLDLDSRN